MNLPGNFANKTMPAECTVWIGACNTRGYGVVIVDGEKQLAHRVAYEAVHGPIPDGLVLDHLCRVRNCVKVEHLEPVTQQENLRRGRSARGLQVGDTCPNGHELAADEDIYTKPSTGATECMTCRREGRRLNRQGKPRPTRQKRADSVRAAVERVA